MRVLSVLFASFAVVNANRRFNKYCDTNIQNRFAAHPWRKRIYFKCDYNQLKATRHRCARKQYFDEEKEQCLWKDDDNAPLDECEGHEDGTPFLDSDDCTQYSVCGQDGQKTTHTCPEDTLFDIVLSFCNHAENTCCPGTSDFDIEIVNAGSNDIIDYAFEAAKDRWECIIRGDLQDVTNPNKVDLFGGYLTNPYTPDVVDDLVIGYEVKAIDGPSNILGFAGPVYQRGFPNGLPISGIMVFDEADIALMEQQGWVSDVILHEMGHVLGLMGTLQADRENGPLVACSQPDNYLGVLAQEAYIAAGFTGQASIERDFGPGSACGHWNENTAVVNGVTEQGFGNELMTPQVDSGEMPLSAITIQALADIGYTVDVNKGDDFGPHNVGARRRRSTEGDYSFNGDDACKDHGICPMLFENAPENKPGSANKLYPVLYITMVLPFIFI